MLEIKTISDLQLLKEQGILKDGYIQAIETCFNELAEALDLLEGVEPRLGSGPFRTLDPEVDE